ncbi:MAG: glycosyltransferase family 2 protein, partial [Planctomycetota bacterium]
MGTTNQDVAPVLSTIELTRPVEIATKAYPAPRDADLTNILGRLERCSQLVESELSAYLSAIADTDLIDKTDYQLSIIIPVYNEVETIGRVVSRVAALPVPKEIVIVDDCSTDGTREVLENLSGLDGVQVILKGRNEGKGAALRTGFENFTGDYAIVQDADLEYDPRDIPRVISPLLRDEADVVYGSRFIGEIVQDESWIHRVGNAMLTKMS